MSLSIDLWVPSTAAAAEAEVAAAASATPAASFFFFAVLSLRLLISHATSTHYSIEIVISKSWPLVKNYLCDWYKLHRRVRKKKEYVFWWQGFFKLLRRRCCSQNCIRYPLNFSQLKNFFIPLLSKTTPLQTVTKELHAIETPNLAVNSQSYFLKDLCRLQ